MDETRLYLEICKRQDREIELSDARAFTFKRMNLSQMEYYLNYCKNTERMKKDLRRMVGFWKYYFYYVRQFIKSYNAYYYTR